VTEQAGHGITGVVEAAASVAEEAVRDPWIQRLAVLGFYTKGFLYVVIGILALAVAIGVRGTRLADPQGAMAVIAEEPYGKVLLVIFVVGAIGHGLWNLLRAITDVDGVGRKWQGIFTRCIQAILGTFYLGMAASALEIVLSAGHAARTSKAEETFIAFALAVPLLGAGFIGLIGLGLIGAGFTECYNGLSGRYQKNYRGWEIKGVHGKLITLLGIISFSVRAVLLVILGYFFLRAVLDERPGKIGIDAALKTLLRTEYGHVVVAVAALGLIGHGLLAFYEARYRKIC
jgi:hypothetical protein